MNTDTNMDVNIDKAMYIDVDIGMDTDLHIKKVAL
jgi:hypothetical protein